jgi:hypothetical protein
MQIWKYSKNTNDMNLILLRSDCRIQDYSQYFDTNGHPAEKMTIFCHQFSNNRRLR